MSTIRSISVLGRLIVGCLLFATTASADGIHLEGQDDVNVDRPALQAAIDSLPSGGVLEIEGVFQLDGEALSIAAPVRIEGVALDDDGDGAVNEDWVDGVDNDGDGLFDEDDWDAELRGLLEADGSPSPETDPSRVFNRAIFVRGLDGDLEGLAVENVAFSGFHRALTLEPDTGSLAGTACENLFPTAGRLVDARIEGNRFTNNGRAIELEGEALGAQVEDNLLTDHSDVVVIAEGGEMGCPLLDGGFGVFPIGVARSTRIDDNVFQRNSLIAIFNVGAEKTRIEGNRIEGGVTAILTQDDPKVRIEENSTEGALFAIELNGSAPKGRVAENTIAGGFFGVLANPGAGGYRIEENDFEGVLLYELFLDFGTSGIHAVVAPEDRVVDFGDNIVVVD